MLARIRLLVILTMTLVYACTGNGGQLSQQALRLHADTFVPEDAVNKVVAPEIRWIQISFDVSREPLVSAISADRLDRARAEGWRVCEPATAGWTSYYDASATPRRYTQNRAYVLYKDGVLIELVGIYYSDNEAASVQRNAGSAAERIQHGMVTARNSRDEEAREAAEVLGAACN